ncbi:unnamed protein product [Periconia digitata]|uniref:Uncharacterized protein n=1 Tax=Periconia digitata TaxID=1303443 RepID=A0A9W4U1Y0_9PLEO|nr:unnamed protein product [Periconia digitata]
MQKPTLLNSESLCAGFNRIPVRFVSTGLQCSSFSRHVLQKIIIQRARSLFLDWIVVALRGGTFMPPIARGCR